MVLREYERHLNHKSPRDLDDETCRRYSVDQFACFIEARNFYK
jgi:hypothetical protein